MEDINLYECDRIYFNNQYGTGTLYKNVNDEWRYVFCKTVLLCRSWWLTLTSMWSLLWPLSSWVSLLSWVRTFLSLFYFWRGFCLSISMMGQKDVLRVKISKIIYIRIRKVYFLHICTVVGTTLPFLLFKVVQFNCWYINILKVISKVVESSTELQF